MIHVYARVSTKQQDTASQEKELKEWVAGKEVKWYRDKFTGKTMDRPGWLKLAAALKSGDTVVIWRLDRLGRTAKGMMEVIEDFRNRNIKLVSLRDGVTDWNTPAGRMFLTMLIGFSVMETEIRAERVKIGQAAAREAGKSWGGRKAGSRSDKIRKLEPQIKTLHHAGTPIKAIAESLGITRPTVYSVLGLTAVAK